MQIYLPLPSFIDSAACLDDDRLVKQLRVIGTVLGGCTSKCAVMWAKYHSALRWYRGIIVDELAVRGAPATVPITDWYPLTLPPWLGDEELHASHRAALLYKDNWYKRYGWTEKPALAYVWR